MRNTKWGNRFSAAATIPGGGGIMTSMALSMVVSQFVFANNLNMIQFL